MGFPQNLHGGLFLALIWLFALQLKTAKATNQDKNLGPGIYYVEYPGTVYVGRPEDGKYGQQTGRICRIQADGYSREEIFVSPDSSEAPESIALDEASGRIYFSSSKKAADGKYHGKIQRINTDGTDLKTLLTLPNVLPASLKLVYHPNQKIIYWVEGESKEGYVIRRFNLNNRTEIETLIDTAKYPCPPDAIRCSMVQDITVDPNKSELYWTQAQPYTDKFGSIHRLSLSMKSGETAVNRTGIQVLLKDQNGPKRMQYIRGTLYWIDQVGLFKGSNIKRMNVDDWGKQEPVVLFQTPTDHKEENINDFVVDADSGNIWIFVSGYFSHFYRASLKGGGFTSLRQWMAKSKSLVYAH